MSIVLSELQGEVSAVVENQDIPYQDMLDSIRSQIDSTSEYELTFDLSTISLFPPIHLSSLSSGTLPR